MQSVAQNVRGIMKKRLSLFIMFMVLLASLPFHAISLATETDGTVKVHVHYHRFDEQYDDWDLWIWPSGKEGKAYAFTQKTPFGVLAELEVPSASSFGIIVRKGNWEAKDVAIDRFFDEAFLNDEGVYELYLLQGAEPIYKSESDIDLSPKFLSARWVDEKSIQLETSKPVSTQEMRTLFSIVDEDGNVFRPAAVSGSGGEMGQRFLVLLAENAVVGKKYETSFLDYDAYAIDPSGLFDTEAFEKAYTYEGALGAIYEKSQTTFKVWAPTAQDMALNLYKTGDGDTLLKTQPMLPDAQGVYQWVETGDLHGVYYTFSVTIDGVTRETYDPYASAVGVNGDRSMVIDFERVNPQGWGTNRGPQVDQLTDILVYEMHIRDFSIHASSGIENAGKYLGVIEEDTKTPSGIKTGLSHLLELGVTHVQILPMYDFNSIDETRLEDNVFNWGYDPKNFNAPEGSYSSDPYHGEVRVNEMKQMIMGLQNNGIGVIMDVVYNHTALSADSNFYTLVPGYYFRMHNGAFSNASGTGNETASERSMMRKYILDSLKFWVEEYHIDGFRFDLMGVHDIETMQLVESELRAINPNIILYGEGWTGGASTLPDQERLIKHNMQAVNFIGAFNDDMRDGIKGHVFNDTEAGFANGALGFEESVKFGVVGATYHPQVDYAKVNYSNAPWANHPFQSINYVEAHDNLTLWDKLLATNPEATDEERIAMHKLSQTIVLTSQGIPFMHLGMDFLRTKDGDHNSYISPDSINQIDWNRKETHYDVFKYNQGLIDLRKNYAGFRMISQDLIASHLTFMEGLEAQLIGYTISKEVDPVNQQELTVFYNGSFEKKTVQLPEGRYMVLLNKDEVNHKGIMEINGGALEIPASSAYVLARLTETYEEKVNENNLLILLGSLLALLGITLYYIKKSKK